MNSILFDHISTSLETYGKLGHASTFEAEIQFAKDLLHRDTNSRKFIVMDEIFHSTNAYDGLQASKVFLEKLYESENCISIISTHYRELPTLFSSNAGAYQLRAQIDDKNIIHYSYKLDQGISNVSSVMELLREHGLISEPAET
jgi:DNA mismatch repair ATPase MutS